MILRRQQLFTENTLTVILPLLLRKSRRLLVRLARLWGAVLLANLLGTFLFAFFVARVDVFPPEVRQAFAATGMAHAGGSLGIVFVRTVFAGWSIALMVWLLPRAESSRVAIIIIVTYLAGLGNFNHIVADSTTLQYLPTGLAVL